MREIIEHDALFWLRHNRDIGSIITSLPDMEETKHAADIYPDWFFEAARECFRSASPGHPIIFYQTDRLLKGRRISKANILMNVATSLNRFQLVYHKIVLRRDPGKTDLRRPGYSHLLCFGDSDVKPGRPTPDVMHVGSVLYPNGMSLVAATTALQTAKRHGDDICDPFCGRGTVPALAEAMGFKVVVGVDIDEKQCAAARSLRLLKQSRKRDRL